MWSMLRGSSSERYIVACHFSRTNTVLIDDIQQAVRQQLFAEAGVRPFLGPSRDISSMQSCLDSQHGDTFE